MLTPRFIVATDKYRTFSTTQLIGINGIIGTAVINSEYISQKFNLFSLYLFEGQKYIGF